MGHLMGVPSQLASDIDVVASSVGDVASSISPTAGPPLQQPMQKKNEEGGKEEKSVEESKLLILIEGTDSFVTAHTQMLSISPPPQQGHTGRERSYLRRARVRTSHTSEECTEGVTATERENMKVR